MSYFMKKSAKDVNWYLILNPFKILVLNFTLFILNIWDIQEREGIVEINTGRIYYKEEGKWYCGIIKESSK